MGILRNHLQSCASHIARRAARQYVAGPTLDHAMQVAKKYALEKIPTTLGYWSAEGEPPQQIHQHNLACLKAIHDAGLDCYISVKAQPLDYSRLFFDELHAASAQMKVRIHYDSLGAASADSTLRLVRDYAATQDVSCTLPSCWLRSVQDADDAVAHGLRVRVVKGQWPNPPHHEPDPVRGYMNIIGKLAGRARHVAVATHDVELAQRAITSLRERGTPCELELLYGLPMRRSLENARSLQVPVRIYIPYGDAWIPYALGALRRNPKILIWLMKDYVRTFFKN